VHHAIARDVFGGKNPETVLYNDNPKVGDFMKRRVFEPGRRLPWNALTKHATGEELNPKAFAADLKQ
jgi:peptidyl-dipeptidase A